MICIVLFSAFCVEGQQELSTEDALKQYRELLDGRLFVAYPQHREHPVTSFDTVSEASLKNAGADSPFVMSAKPGEFYVYQVAVWALEENVNDLTVGFSDLKTGGGEVISSDAMTCFNTGGIDFRGRPFSKKVDVPAGRVQALWMGIDVGKSAKGRYRGQVTIRAEGRSQAIPLLLQVSGAALPNHGYNEGKRLSRLNWLNSRAGIDEKVTKGFLPVEVNERTIKILGRTLTIAPNGLPATITSFFGPSNQALLKEGETVVAKPFRFIIEKSDGELLALSPGKLTIIEQTPKKVVWKVVNTSDACTLACTARMEFDGFVEYHLTLTAHKEIEVKDIRLEVSVASSKASCMMGLGREGGTRPSKWHWKWDTDKNQDMLWLGAVNGGVRMKWKAENYVRPLINIYYHFGPLQLPPSWGNGGRGGVDVFEQKEDVMVRAYSGARKLVPGRSLHYDFELLLTPFKLIDRNLQFNDRYFHRGGGDSSRSIDEALQAGANIINIHHAQDIYPFINYPYLDENIAEITQLVDKAHEKHLRLKLYYTTRELTKNLPEFCALYSLSGEVIFPGPGNECKTLIHPNGPHPWLKKNLREHYIPAWANLIRKGKFKGRTDLSVITTPDSRLNNFYIAGLQWMVRHLGIDGVYIDDSALDRTTLCRARKILDRNRPAGRMDLHSWNHFNRWAGFTSCLNLYMDLLPYFDLVWIGEGRDYNRMPDHWLVEVSGIPFGLTGQMLQGGGNPWRGLVYGITNRAGWTGNPPTHLWRVFDTYDFSEREMIGYWDRRCPVKSSSPLIKATCFKGADDCVISIANWSSHDEEASLTLAWPELGMAKADAKITIPAITNFQEGRSSVSLEQLVVPGGKGYIIVVGKTAE